MESDLGKLFIGGISWNTDEDRLKEYFGSFGEVVEAVIMRDRATGRARGFGFIVFADPAVAERVVAEKHMIDGRTVEAKKAVPRDDQQMVNRNVGNLVQGSSPNPGRTKKIFVGGLASTVSESDFKAYFDQFGTITDVVVMYDHNTQRPRGFGFITFDSEEAVERVLHKTFHELNSKMVEVKRAVPKELSPGPARSPIPGYNYGFNRPTSFLSNYAQGYNNLSSLAGYGGRFNPLGNRSSLSPFGSLGYGIGMNLDPSLSLSIGGPTNFNNTNLGYGRVSSPYRYSTPIGYGGPTGVGNDSPLGATTWNPWGNSGINSVANVSSPPPYMSNGGGRFGVFGNRGSNWGSSPLSPQGDRSASGYAGGESSYRLSGGGFGRNNGSAVSATSSFAAPGGGFEGSYGDLYQSGSVYGDPGWRSASPEIDGSSSFDNALGDVAEVAAKGSEDYIGGYSIANRKTNRGIAA